MITLKEYMKLADKYYHQKGYQFSKKNLKKILSVLACSLDAYPRVFAFRCDLRFPLDEVVLSDEMLTMAMGLNETKLMKRFLEEFKRLIRRDIAKKCREDKRYHKTEVRYVWAREQAGSIHPHFHLVIFLNRDAYARIGRYDSMKMNIANKVRAAWLHAISAPEEVQYEGLVHFPVNAEYTLKRVDVSTVNDFLIRSAYLAKNETKDRGHGFRCFGGSNI